MYLAWLFLNSSRSFWPIRGNAACETLESPAVCGDNEFVLMSSAARENHFIPHGWRQLTGTPSKSNKNILPMWNLNLCSCLLSNSIHLFHEIFHNRYRCQRRYSQHTNGLLTIRKSSLWRWGQNIPLTNSYNWYLYLMGTNWYLYLMGTYLCLWLVQCHVELRQ